MRQDVAYSPCYKTCGDRAGVRDVIVDGQLSLARAAKAAGVRRFFPSDYSFDLFSVPEGINRLARPKLPMPNPARRSRSRRES